MSTGLNSGGYIPLTQPYNVAPWNFAGNERTSSIPPGVVDWVLLELRSDSSAGSVVARRAAFMKSNGMVVDTDGTSPVGFRGPVPGPYYLVVRHRNHLAIMSANAVALSASSALYDFTTGQGQAYSTNPGVLDPMIGLGTGGTAPFGMIAGDANSNRTINAADRTATRLGANSSGYRLDDVSLDGNTNAADRTKTRRNANKTTSVP
jgi:hypothetical protein